MFNTLSEYWNKIQRVLFPELEEELGPLTDKQMQLISTLEIVRIEQFLPTFFGCVGRPLKDRKALARALVAKSVYNMPTTKMLIERLKSDLPLCQICGWENRSQVPDESTFSRAFSEFATSKLPKLVHDALVVKVYEKRIVGHVSRDSTSIQGRENPIRKEKKSKIPKKRGRPKKGKERPKESKRLDKQLKMTKQECFNDLPRGCDIGGKRNSKGNKEYWIGYKYHIDTADGDIPLSCILTSASLHDSQVAIPLAAETSGKVTNLYDLMDAAYDCSQITEHSKSLGHIPIIDKNARRNTQVKDSAEAEAKAQKTINWKPPEKIRYNQRSSAERVNSRLKDDFGGRMVRVSGNAKVACHLMFGILALTAHALLNLVR